MALMQGFAYRIFGLCLILTLGGCAVQSTPEGGEKDTVPPEIVRTVPENRSLHFSAGKIEIEFNEYVKLDNFTGQFISSPPLKHPVEHHLRGKRLILELEDTLRPNTTYTFSFGNCIKDITENNPQTEFKYVFSTGAILDSQIVSGTITDAFTAVPQTGVMVAMYDTASEDSAFMKEPPLYYGLTDENGSFTIENMSPGAFRMVAIEDKNFDYTWSGAAERLAFPDGIIYSSDNPSVTLRMFKSGNEYKFYRGKYADFGKLEMYFSVPADSVLVERLDTNDTGFYIERPLNGDTIQMWTSAIRAGDYGEWLIRSGELAGADTMKVKFTEKDTTQLKLALSTKPPFSPADSVIITSTTPLLSSNIPIRVTDEDSVQIAVEVIRSGVRNIRLEADWQYGKKYTWSLDSGMVRDLFGQLNDSTGQTFKILQDNELSIFHLNVQSDSIQTKVLEIFNDKGVVLYSTRLTDGIQVDLVDLHPQKIQARVIYDRNGNGKWDPGDYFEGRQPEKVIYLEKTVELRANWEIDETWLIP